MNADLQKRLLNEHGLVAVPPANAGASYDVAGTLCAYANGPTTTSACERFCDRVSGCTAYAQACAVIMALNDEAWVCSKCLKIVKDTDDEMEDQGDEEACSSPFVCASCQ